MVFDKPAFFDATVLSGTPVSAATDLEVLNGANACAIGQEILQFKNVVNISGNQFRFSYLLRGRLGTEQFMNSHGANELVVFLSKSTIVRALSEPTSIGSAKYWKAVGVGQTLNSSGQKTFTNTGLSNKPWAPVFIKGTRGVPLADDLTITWFRRTRIQGEWVDFRDIIVGETEEKYKVEVLDQNGAVLRTFEPTTTTQIYLGTEQTTDFGSAQALILIRVLQQSSVFGDGYSNTELL